MTQPSGFGRFRDSESGAIAILFCIVLTAVLFAIGVTLDYGRALSAANKVSDAMDAASLAAAQYMTMDDTVTDSDVEAKATTFFQSNLGDLEARGVAYSKFKIKVDRAAGSVSISADVQVPTTFTKLAGFNSVTLDKSATAVFKMKAVELAMVLDITGSMNTNGKISALQNASKDVLDILLPDGEPTLNRIALAPYSAAVNAGPYAAPSSDSASTDNCVVERDGAYAYTEDAPALGRFFNAGDTTGNGNYRCPAAEILPLTKDKTALKNRIDSLAAGGATAGHIGIGWGWYELSPDWSSIWPASSRPKAYSDANAIKAVILMTDGVFNTSYFNGLQNDLTMTPGSSLSQAAEICTSMKAKGVQVFTVGFLTDLDPADPATINAVSVLQGCASGAGNYFLAENAAELKTAFQTIASSLQSLRLSN